MALLFYLLFVWLSDSVSFSWGWFFVALIFSSQDTKTIYKYTSDKSLEGEVENEI